MKRTIVKKDGTQRYSSQKHPIYHRTYHQLKDRSFILNDERRANSMQNSNALYGVAECKGTLNELKGNKEGYYLSEGNWYLALIPDAKNKLIRVHRKFKKWQKEQVQGGYALSKPKKWPADLLEERLKAEALFDIRIAEKKKVEQRIEKLENQRKKEKRNPVLPNGPLGNISTDKNLIVEADGQRVSYSNEGIPFIDEPDSPYHGLPIAHYRKMCKQWKKDIGITLDQLRERRDKMFEAERKQAIKEGKEPPAKRLPVTNARLPQWMKRLGIGKKEWPEWPEGAKPIET